MKRRLLHAILLIQWFFLFLLATNFSEPRNVKRSTITSFRIYPESKSDPILYLHFSPLIIVLFDCISVNYPCSFYFDSSLYSSKTKCVHCKWQRFKFQLCLSKIALNCFCTYAILPTALRKGRQMG